MEKILVSSCLVGNKVRYNGGCISINEPNLEWLRASFELVIFCPEVSSGLPIPRPPAEIIGGTGAGVINKSARVVDNNGVDVTREFLSGATNALKICQENGILYAVLAEKSPSCGSSKIYDGTFSRREIAGWGVTTELLEQSGIKVFSQHNIASLKAEME